MTTREGKALNFISVPADYAGGVQEGDATPAYINGVASNADLQAHISSTGTSVHGLGTSSILDATAIGSGLLQAADEETARDLILAAPLRENVTQVTTAARTFALADEGMVLAQNSTTTTTTLNMTVAVSNSFATGAQIHIERWQASGVAIAADAGLTINGFSSVVVSRRWGRVTIRKISATEWSAWGDWQEGAATYTVTTTGASELTTINNLTATGNVTVDWGDGTTNTYATGSHTPTHTYTAIGSYNVKIKDAHRVTDLRVFSQSAVGGDVSGFAPLTNLTQLYCHSTSVSGDVSGFAPLTNLTWLYCYNTSVSYATGGMTSAALNDVQFQNSGWSQADVDAFLYEMYQLSTTPRTATVGTINVGGTNAAPSGVFQPAAACPVTVATPGNEIANELLNNGCAAGFNVWATVTTS